MKVCCFAGHNEVYGENIKKQLFTECAYLIEKCMVTEFLIGNYGGFDMAAVGVTQNLKKVYPHIKRTLIIPYLTRSINEHQKLYKVGFDDIVIADMPENTPKRLRIIKANEFMVNSSDFIICCVDHEWGGAFKTLEYARKKDHIKIINIANKKDSRSCPKS